MTDICDIVFFKDEIHPIFTENFPIMTNFSPQVQLILLLLVCHTAAGNRSWYPTDWGTSLKTSKTRALPLNRLVGKSLMTLSKTSPINLALVDNKDVDLKPVSEEEYSSNWL